MKDHFESVGNLESWELKDNWLLLEVENAKGRIAFVEEGTARIQFIRKDENFIDETYSVPTHGFSHISVQDQEDHILAISSELTIKISRFPVRITFLNPSGEILNQDDPAFGIAWEGFEVTNYKLIRPGERFFGLGEKTGVLDHRGKYYTNWNTDHFGYGPESDPLYFSCPFFMGLSQQKFYGIFLDNTYRTNFNFGASNDRFSFFQATGGQLNYYFFAGKNPSEIVTRYTNLTGRPEMPPIWSLGFQQCRYSYYPDSEALNLARTFREKKIPADVIYLDIHYMQDYKVFTWHQERFPDPKTFIRKLTEMGFKVVIIIDPGVKIDEPYEAYTTGLEKNVFVTYPDGTLYSGAVWPGWCHFPDFTNPQTREWWANHFKELVDAGVSGFWNDMNEPAVWGKQFPDITRFSLEGRNGGHKEAHNIYGMQMSKATLEGAVKFNPDDRPFLLTRAGFSGSQRYTWVWTGDNVSNDEHLMMGCRLVNSLGLSGLPFSGNDIGGFIGESNPALYMRWIALGAFHPLYRSHTMINSRDAEPWSFGEEAEDISRQYINLRYKLLPYFYSLMFEATQNGLPPCRSLIFEFSDESKVYQPPFDSEFLLGKTLLIRPVTSTDNLVKIFLPKGKWYDLFTDEVFEGSREHIIEAPLDKLPVFCRGGFLFTLQSVVQHTGEKHNGLLEIHLYNGEEESTFLHYEDDGQTHAHKNGQFYKRYFSYSSENQLILSKATGDFPTAFKMVRLYLHGSSPSEVAVNEESVSINQEDYRFIQPVSDFDPYEDHLNDSNIIKSLPFVEVPLEEGEMKFRWK